jgi:small subunit ribosomal protein S3
MKKAIELAKKIDIRGIKIQIARHLNEAESALVEWAREGRVPLQTLRARIGYCYYLAQTIYGVLRIKVWIFQDKK